MLLRIAVCCALCAAACAQTVCPPTPQYTPCDLVFDVPGSDGAKPISLQAEYRSPRLESGIVKAFWDGGTRWIIRITPSDAGIWAYKLTGVPGSSPGGSDPAAVKEGQFTATPAARAGWLRAANVHHFAFVDPANKVTPHLWMGAVEPGFAAMDINRWKSLVDGRAAQRFNHIGITLVDRTSAGNFRTPEFFRATEDKIRYANQRGIIIDIAFFGPDGLMDQLLPAPADRRQWFTYAVSRLAGFDITWQGNEAWETYGNPRDELKEIAEYIASLDPYKHPCSTRTIATSGGLMDLAGNWLRYRSYQTGDAAVSAVEQQLYEYPAVNNFSVGATDTDAFRHRLWNATMSGQYPSAEIPDDRAATTMKIWYDLLSQSRHWELEPFFDLDGGRGLALGGIEYLIYVEKPSGPVTAHLEDHGYDGAWINPATGQFTKIKEVKGALFTGDPPDRSHDWILRISREGTKASMAKSYKFDSREIIMQTVEGNPDKVPFEVVEPAADSLSLSAPAHFAIKLKRETKAMQQMMYEWTGEVTLDNRGYRIIGTGLEGTLSIPAGIAIHYPAALHVRINAVNGLGKAYVLDRNYTLNK